MVTKLRRGAQSRAAVPVQEQGGQIRSEIFLPLPPFANGAEGEHPATPAGSPSGATEPANSCGPRKHERHESKDTGTETR